MRSRETDGDVLAFFCAAALGLAFGFAWRAVCFLAFRAPVFFLAFREAVFFRAFRAPVFFLAFREAVCFLAFREAAFFLTFREPVFFLAFRAPVFFLVVATRSSCTPAMRGSGCLIPVPRGPCQSAHAAPPPIRGPSA